MSISVKKSIYFSQGHPFIKHYKLKPKGKHHRDFQNQCNVSISDGDLRKSIKVPDGTPEIPPLDIVRRPRRNRRSPTIRDAVRETHLSPSNIILPLFIQDNDENTPIHSMPGVFHLGYKKGLIDTVSEAKFYGINQIIIFPKIPIHLKSQIGEESFNPDGLVQRSIRLLKDKFPNLEIYTDVALAPYSIDGHNGIVRDDGVIMNDETVSLLCCQALSHAEAGADVIAPSDMMDGRIGEIRKTLDENGFTNVSIMSYSAKYASSFYGPFRDALLSAPAKYASRRLIPKDKSTYQMDPGNAREAILEADLDEQEGADILLVKPGLPYLDIINALYQNSNLPIAAYHVSGEYAMLKAAAQNGWLNERETVLESLLCIKRAGASLILTYFGLDAAKWMAES